MWIFPFFIVGVYTKYLVDLTHNLHLQGVQLKQKHLKCNLNYEFETSWDIKVEKWNPLLVECDPLEGFVGSKSKEFLGYFSCGCCWVIELLFNLKFETYNSIFAMYVEEFYPICEMLLWVLIGNKAYKYCMLRLKINLLFQKISFQHGIKQNHPLLDGGAFMIIKHIFQ